MIKFNENVLAAILLLSSCTVFEEPNISKNEPTGPYSDFAIEATIGNLEMDDTTKANANTVIRLGWNYGDEISVINLSTGKALGGSLKALGSGATTEFSGMLIGTINNGDMLGFIYPSQGYEDEQDFTGAKIDLSEQDGSVSEDKFALSGTFRYGGSTNNLKITFNFLVSYMMINMTDLPAGEKVEEICLTEIGNAVNLTISSLRNGFVATASDIGEVKIRPNAMSVNGKGVKTFFFKVPTSPSTTSRQIKVSGSNFDYVTEFTSSALSMNKFYYTTVTDFHEALYIPDTNFEAYLIENFDLDGNGELSMAECEEIREIQVCSDNIVSAKGIEKMPNLTVLEMMGTRGGALINGRQQGYYISNNLEHISPIDENDSITTSGSLKSIDISHNGNLEVLSLSNNDLEILDLSSNHNVKQIWANYNPLRDIILPSENSLEELFLGHNWLNALLMFLS